MSDLPLVSIITPAFNCAEILKPTVESICNQTYKNWELLVIDDGSNDNTPEVIRKLAAGDGRIKPIFLNENQGAAVARNAGLNCARSHVIAFLDSDDLWVPTKLEVQIAFMTNNNFGLTYTSYSTMDSDGVPTGKIISAKPTLDLNTYLKTTLIGCSTAIINKDIVGDFEFHNIRTRQDTHLWITILSRGHLAHGLNEPLTIYRERNDSISANKFKAAKQVWNLYHNIIGLGILRSTYYFGHYAKNGIRKRL